MVEYAYDSDKNLSFLKTHLGNEILWESDPREFNSPLIRLIGEDLWLDYLPIFEILEYIWLLLYDNKVSGFLENEIDCTGWYSRMDRRVIAF